MNELELFANRINSICSNPNGLTIEEARNLIKEINDFFYTNYDGIGNVEALNETFEYLSDFHKYWSEHYETILDITIDEDKCEQVAEKLHDVYISTSGEAFNHIYPTRDLSAEEICRIRFLTANQDFRGSRDFQYLIERYQEDPDIFNESIILDNPQRFLEFIGVTGLSQSDKRETYAKNVCEFLISHNSSPYNLIDCYDRDLYRLRTALIENKGAGYGNKKTDMFIRDMVLLGVWDGCTGFDRIDVASDINTIKVALRTGIMSSKIPLVSSFIDVFCYQYGYVDRKSALAWRTVWEKYNAKFPDESLASPSLLDYFVYKLVGQELCKNNVHYYTCDNGHSFKWYSKGKQICRNCSATAHVIKSTCMCCDTDGSIVIERIKDESLKALLNGYINCPLKAICDSTNKKHLNPPKSISIKGQTGWTSAYARRNCGGGGLMA